MMNNSNKRGFTLIELLVVIAIIGILASVVLASLNTARDKGSDAAIKSNLANVRAQAEIVYDTQDCYGDGAGTCLAAAVAPGACPAAGAAVNDTLFTEPGVNDAIAAAKSAGGAGSFNACSSSADQASWAIVQQLKSTPALGWCVDSQGTSKQITAATADQAGFTAEVSAAGACVD